MSPRPAPFVPLSVTFATGKTGTAILEQFGCEGLGAWAAMLAAADRGLVVFRHEDDWAAIGIAVGAPHFELSEFLAFLGRRKVTRKTRQGRATYVQITQWEDWNNTKLKETARQQKARKRAESKPDKSRTEDGQQSDAGQTQSRAEAEQINPGLNGSSDREGQGFEIPELRAIT